MFCVQCLGIGRHDQEKDHHGTKHQANQNVEDRLPAGILFIARRHDDVVILHLPVGKCILQLPLFYLSLTGIMLGDIHIMKYPWVIPVNL